jgi:hypothetical protein
MGYDLHITRRAVWSEKGDDISADEWLDLVAADPELRLSPKDGPYFAIWKGASQLPDPWLDWSDGQIHTKNPDRALVAKMILLARRLTATVQGDDGEEYTQPTDFPDDPESASTGKGKGRTVVFILISIALLSLGGLFCARDGKERSIFGASALLWSYFAYWLIKQSRPAKPH